MKVAALLLPSSRDVVRGVSSVDSVVMVMVFCRYRNQRVSAMGERFVLIFRHWSENDSGTRSISQELTRDR